MNLSELFYSSGSLEGKRIMHITKKNMTFFITGASKGIGEYLCDYYTGQGHTVYGSFNTKNNHKVNHTQVDVKNRASVESWITNRASHHESLVLINCAGITYNAMGHSGDLDSWKDVIDTNLTGSYNACRAILPFMRTKGFGRIINLSSIVAQKAIAGTSAYASSKSGLWGLTKSLATENASKGITINCLNLGYFNIGMIEKVPDNILKGIVASIPMGRLGSPIEIVQSMDFLIANSYITGTSIDINGGLY